MQYHGENTMHMCFVKQKNPISLMAICVLFCIDATLFFFSSKFETLSKWRRTG
jgi:hypothetical protein